MGREGHAVVFGAFGRANGKFGFRLVHYSVQGNHMHLIVEAEGTASLARAMKGLCVRIARQLNRELGRQGRVFADRYHARALSTPREVYSCLRYVLLNRKHRNEQLAGRAEEYGVDECSSSAYFDGWAAGAVRCAPRLPGEGDPVLPATTWLLKTGWRRYGPIDPFRRG